MPSVEQYAEMRRKSLQRNRPDLYRELAKAGELQSHLKEIGESASAMEANLFHQMEQKNPLPKDFLERVIFINRALNDDCPFCLELLESTSRRPCRPG